MKELLHHEYNIRNAALTPFELGVVNRNYRVDADGERYVLKSYATQHYKPQEIRRVIQIQELVRTQGFPVPAVIPNRQGEGVTETADGFVVLSRFAEGHHLERGHIPPNAARSMGETLGRLQTLLEPIEELRPYKPSDLAITIEFLEKMLGMAEQKLGHTPAHEAARETLRWKIRALPMMEPYLAKFETLRSQLLHGDYQETNVLFDDQQRVSAVIDFDNIRVLPRARELMRAMSICFFVQGELLPEAFDFLSAYHEQVQAPEAEVALYAPLCAYYHLFSTWPINVLVMRPEAYDVRWDRFLQPPNTFWESNIDRLTDQFLSVI
ncbi:MAG: phosphotransferase [Tumebacillaceae bacterium]